MGDFTVYKLPENVKVLGVYSPSTGAFSCTVVKLTFCLLAGSEIQTEA